MLSDLFHLSLDLNQGSLHKWLSYVLTQKCLAENNEIFAIDRQYKGKKKKKRIDRVCECCSFLPLNNCKYVRGAEKYEEELIELLILLEITSNYRLADISLLPGRELFQPFILLTSKSG